MDRFPVIMGEVLFDCFGDDSVLGGAPFNVAWHLQGFGLNPRFVSRVGADALGAEARARMQDWGLDTRWLAIDPEHPTGRVSVHLTDGQPSYDILPAQAYDYILPPDALGGCGDSLFYHGSLVARSEVSRATLLGLRAAFAGRVFVDVNLRDPWWSMVTLWPLVVGAAWLKLNEDEAIRLVEAGDAARLARERQAGRVVLTRGAQGADVYDGREHLHHVTPPTVVDLVDAVGAGDAFSAVVILGLIEDWAWPVLLRRATAFAARVCGWRGALSDDRTIYREILSDWRGTASS
ncbi:hypothetical protein BI364_15100 [Acidihalobacter yilgarnensis]|uniref:Carbohydrate kinase PfkB domain-containing protein n=1 Tax=Acidihalobacter yilgarnensis TaxID=2819280 RepID=A0A1D8IRH2_9GAMM|nr:carbohydrate kinase [Acidihalobacter yilgarnensis]AOU99091.1 hypothetical protein BI364_15100 [Acidihalobacter yilgarnensis]